MTRFKFFVKHTFFFLSSRPAKCAMALALCLCLYHTGHAQNVPDTVVSVEDTSGMYDDDADADEKPPEYYDEDNVNTQGSKAADLDQPTIRTISADSLQRLKADPDFAYMSYIDSFFRYRNMPNVKYNPPKYEPTTSIFDVAWIRMLYWGIAIAAVLYILWRLFLSNQSIFGRNRQLPTVQTVQEEDISKQPADTLIDKAIAAKDYRMAIRYLYLHTLAKMGEKDLVVLAPQKTNHQYVRELTGKDLQPAFSTLTLQYEYVWFGEFKLAAEQFDSVHKGFKSFISKVG